MKILLSISILFFCNFVVAENCANEGQMGLTRIALASPNSSIQGYGSLLGICRMSESSNKLEIVQVRGSELAVTLEENINNPDVVKAFKDLSSLESLMQIKRELLDGNVLSANNESASQMKQLNTILDAYNTSSSAAKDRPHLAMTELGDVARGNMEAMAELQKACKQDPLSKRANLKPVETRFADDKSQGMIPLSFELKEGMNFVIVYLDPSKPQELQTRTINRSTATDKWSDGKPGGAVYNMAPMPFRSIESKNLSGLPNMLGLMTAQQSWDCWAAGKAPPLSRQIIKDAEGTIRVQ